MPKNRYLREINEQVSGATGTSSSGGNTDHGRLAGLSDDDHPQYLTESRHGDIDAADHGSGTATDGYVLTADGSGGADWEDLPPLADHDHSGDAGDGGTFDAANLTSGAATEGHVLTADGAGGAAWESPPAGGVIDAADVTYTPATAADWDSDTDPGNLDDALDQLAERVTDMEETPPGGASDFTDLGDVPASYSGQGGKYVAVKATEDGLEFL